MHSKWLMRRLENLHFTPKLFQQIKKNSLMDLPPEFQHLTSNNVNFQFFFIQMPLYMDENTLLSRIAMSTVFEYSIIRKNTIPITIS